MFGERGEGSVHGVVHQNSEMHSEWGTRVYGGGTPVDRDLGWSKHQFSVMKTIEDCFT